MIANFRIHESSIEGLSLLAISHHYRPEHRIEAMPHLPQRFFIYNTLTKRATSSAPTPELIEHIYNWNDGSRWFPKRGPEQVIVEVDPIFGISLANFDKLPMTAVWAGVAKYAKTKGITA